MKTLLLSICQYNYYALQYLSMMQQLIAMFYFIAYCKSVSYTKY